MQSIPSFSSIPFHPSIHPYIDVFHVSNYPISTYHLPSIYRHPFFLPTRSIPSIHPSIHSFFHLFIYPSFTQIFLFHPIPFINPSVNPFIVFLIKNYDMIMNDAGDWKYWQINKAKHLQNFFTIEYRRPEMPRDNLVVVIFF